MIFGLQHFFFFFITKEGLFTICIYRNTISKLDKVKIKINRRTEEEKIPIGGTPSSFFISIKMY